MVHRPAPVGPIGTDSFAHHTPRHLRCSSLQADQDVHHGPFIRASRTFLDLAFGFAPISGESGQTPLPVTDSMLLAARNNCVSLLLYLTRLRRATRAAARHASTDPSVDNTR